MNSASNIVELLSVFLILVVVLGLTVIVTRWIGNYQKNISVGSNMEIIETMRLTPNKYVQIIRVGSKYIAIAVCKDTVTTLCEIPEESIKRSSLDDKKGGAGFKEIFEALRSSNPIDQEKK